MQSDIEQLTHWEAKAIVMLSQIARADFVGMKFLESKCGCSKRLTV